MMLDDLNRAIKVVKDAPPPIHRMIARYDVPGVFRYWDTKGRLIVYVNRHAIEKLPRVKHRVGNVDIMQLVAPVNVATVGIPVVYEGPSASDVLVKMIEDKLPPITKWSMR